jgi:hypothetical protein
MTEPYRIRKMRHQYEKACRRRTVLLECLKGAEDDLEKLSAIIADYEKHGRQLECDSLEYEHYQLQINCAHLLRQISLVEGPLEDLEMTLRDTDAYLRDSGFYPGL